jgi:hypothetical protein
VSPSKLVEDVQYEIFAHNNQGLPQPKHSVGPGFSGISQQRRASPTLHREQHERDRSQHLVLRQHLQPPSAVANLQPAAVQLTMSNAVRIPWSLHTRHVYHTAFAHVYRQFGFVPAYDAFERLYTDAPKPCAVELPSSKQDNAAAASWSPGCPVLLYSPPNKPGCFAMPLNEFTADITVHLHRATVSIDATWKNTSGLVLSDIVFVMPVSDAARTVQAVTGGNKASL